MTVLILGVAIAVSKLLNVLGLLADICGAVLLFKFGLPENINRSGHISRALEQTDEAEIAKAKKYDHYGKIALALLVVGFTGQLAGNFF
jgi:hypothetical protein